MSAGAEANCARQCSITRALSAAGRPDSRRARSAGWHSTGANTARRRAETAPSTVSNSRQNVSRHQSSKPTWLNTRTSRLGAPPVVITPTRIGQSRSRSNSARESARTASTGVGVPSCSVVATTSGRAPGGWTRCFGHGSAPASNTVRSTSCRRTR